MKTPCAPATRSMHRYPAASLPPLLLALVVLGACSRATSAEGPAAPAPEDRYASLPDATVCVVDRTTRRGLRELRAKQDADGTLLLRVGDEVLTLEQIHPVGIVAGYAGVEPWYRSDEPITLQGQRYRKLEAERRIPIDQLEQSAEYRAIPVFAAPGDAPPPEAVYVPVRPGCIFQAYVREDLL